MNNIQYQLSAGSLYRGHIPDQLQAGIAHFGGLADRVDDKGNLISQGYYSACMSDDRLRLGAPFPDNAHEIIEKAVTKVQRKRLSLVNDLIDAGLTTLLPDWWGIPSIRRGSIGEAGRAHRTMVPDTRGERFVLQRGGTSWPIFCTWSNFSFNIREIEMGRRVGTPLDVSHISQATYLTNEAVEDQAWNGLTDEQGSVMTIDDLSAPGILSADSATWSYADWNTLTGAQIVDLVRGAIELLRITHPGPYDLRVPGNYSLALTKQYSTTYAAGTVRYNLEQLGPYGGRNLRVKLDDSAPDHRAVLIQMDPESVDVVVGQQPVPVSWKDGPGWNTYWVVLACVIFRMFTNANGEYGVAVGNLE